MTDNVEEKNDQAKPASVEQAEEKAEAPKADKAEKAPKKIKEAENTPAGVKGAILSSGLGPVPIYATTADAHAASKAEAKAAGVTPAAVFNSAPEGGSSGDD